jgi:hypothetical protein
MPMYMDIHQIEGATAEDVAKAHIADVETQAKHGVEYHKYWFNESQGKIFCLCSAPSPEAAASVHREAHGLLAAKIIEVAPEIAEGFLGGREINPAGAALVPGGTEHERDPGIRTILFTDIVDSTALTQRVGDDAAMALLGVHDAIVREALGALGGREVKHTGDGIMACFVSTVAAVAALRGSSAHSPSRRTGSSRSGFGSVPRRESPSKITWICSDLPFTLRRGCVRMPSLNRVWYRTPLPSCALARG